MFLPGMMKDRRGRELSRIGTWKEIELRESGKKGDRKRKKVGWFGGVRQQVS